MLADSKLLRLCVASTAAALLRNCDRQMASPTRPPRGTANAATAAGPHASQRKTAAGASSRPSALAQLVKWLLLALVTNAALSRALTQTWTWGYEGKWIKPRTVRKPSPRLAEKLGTGAVTLEDELPLDSRRSRPDKHPPSAARSGMRGARNAPSTFAFADMALSRVYVCVCAVSRARSPVCPGPPVRGAARPP